MKGLVFHIVLVEYENTKPNQRKKGKVIQEE